jgi:cytochrome c oxidase subunit 2
MAMLRSLGLGFACALGGCAGKPIQSVLHPAGPDASQVTALWWVMLALSMFVFAIVLAAAVMAYRKRGTGDQPPMGPFRFILAGGVVLPLIILGVLLVFSLRITADIGTRPADLTVRVTGFQWWWAVEYPAHGITTANEVYVPLGKRVRLEITSGDVIHSLWVPNLQGKMDAIPAHVNAISFTGEKAGVYRGQCAEFCGLQHARMGLTVVVQSEEDFTRWLEEKQAAVSRFEAQEKHRGEQVFFDAACHACHRIRGTAAVGQIGPDLTHVGSRLTLGAATIVNSQGALAGWISNPQAIKPGNLMPASHLPPDDLHALVEYLMILQ